MTALLELFEQSTQSSQQSAGVRAGGRACASAGAGACLRVSAPEASSAIKASISGFARPLPCGKLLSSTLSRIPLPPPYGYAGRSKSSAEALGQPDFRGPAFEITTCIVSSTRHFWIGDSGLTTATIQAQHELEQSPWELSAGLYWV